MIIDLTIMSLSYLFTSPHSTVILLSTLAVKSVTSEVLEGWIIFCCKKLGDLI